MKKPFVSIIIPIYNAREFIRQSIESTLNQTFSDVEVICVDDKSTDDSATIVEEYVKKDKRIHLLRHGKNMGTLKARSTGVEAAQGQYIMFLDNDDELELFACEKLHVITKQHNAEIYGFGVTVICSDEIKWRKTESIKTYNGYLHGMDIMRKCVVEREISRAVWDKMYASEPCKKAHELIGNYHADLKQSPLGEDVLAFVATAYFSETFFSVDEPLYKYNYGKGFMGHAPLTLKGYTRVCMSALTAENFRDFFAKQGKLEEYSEIISAINILFTDLCMGIYLARIAVEDREDALKLIMHYWPHRDLAYRFGLLAADIRKKTWEAPFELLQRESRLVIYGGGDVGRDYYRQIADSCFCEITLWIDKDYKAISKLGFQVSSPEEIVTADYDRILIAVRDPAIALSIKRFLIDSLDVKESTIIWQDLDVVKPDK